ncbi:MoxR family ATPase [soil metagenome]
MSMEARAAKFRERFAALEAEIGKVIVGQPETVRGVLTCLFVGGHVLLEGVPGLGKTLLVRTLAAALDLHFARIQFTPDLMPSDIIGTNIISEGEDGKRDFRFQSGPLFAQIVLADEINRATPKTQSAMLEAMQEHSVSVGGVQHKLEEPFFVLATQNPIEQEGTYPLPEAQLDRFFYKLVVPFTTREELNLILDRTTRNENPKAGKVMDSAEIVEWMGLVREVIVAKPVQDYAIRLLLATHPNSEYATDDTNRFLRCGGSPRGAQALVLAAKLRALLEGRYNVSFQDIRSVYLPAMRHRVLLNFEAQAENISSDTVLAAILNGVKENPDSK